MMTARQTHTARVSCRSSVHLVVCKLVFLEARPMCRRNRSLYKHTDKIAFLSFQVNSYALSEHTAIRFLVFYLSSHKMSKLLRHIGVPAQQVATERHELSCQMPQN